MQSIDSASSSESDSTEEEERLRRLFSSCDRDGDGYIDRYSSIEISAMTDHICSARFYFKAPQ